MGMGGQRHAPAAFAPAKTWYPFYSRPGGSQDRSERVRKISPPPGFDLRTVQPLESRYTDWATPAHDWMSNCLISSECKYGSSSFDIPPTPLGQFVFNRIYSKVGWIKPRWTRVALCWCKQLSRVLETCCCSHITGSGDTLLRLKVWRGTVDRRTD